MKMKQLTASMIALVMSMSLPMTTYAANWDLEKGSITVDAGDSGQTVTQDGKSKPDEAPVITQTNSAAETNNTITINASENATANVTISNVNINTSGAAVSTGGKGNVNIELDGTNTLKSGNWHAGLEKNNDGKLTITDKNENGKLSATGGYDGAGIGGGDKGMAVTSPLPAERSQLPAESMGQASAAATRVVAVTSPLPAARS